MKEFDNQLTYLTIDLSALEHNIKAIKGQLSKSTSYMSVIKADGYGHGAIQVAKTAIASGADFLVVARLEEAIMLRQNGINAPILLLGTLLIYDVILAAKNSITISVNGYGQALLINEILKGKGLNLDLHIKIDSGMGRLGLLLNDSSLTNQSLISEIEDINSLSNLRVTGLYSHFATADEEDSNFAKEQLSKFSKLVSALKERGYNSLLYHCANSAALFTLKESHFNAVRCGLIQYGLYPFEGFDKKFISLKPVLSWYSTIVHIKKVPKDFCVSYGCSAKTNRESLLATVGVGYGDGYSRALSNCGYMLVNGQRAPIVGRVCMDLTIIDVTGIDCMVGDKVVLIGTSGGLTITADDIARATNTISYEVVSTICKRVPRFYK